MALAVHPVLNLAGAACGIGAVLCGFGDSRPKNRRLRNFPEGACFMSHVHPLYLPTPYQDAVESGRLILRDGTTATLRVAQRADRQALQTFFQHLSPESRWRRFFTPAVPAAQLINSLCDSSNPHNALA